MNTQLILGDCLDCMRQMADASVDLVVTSPPYDNMRTYNGAIAQWSHEKFMAIADELFRVLKPGACLVWIVADATVKGSETGSSFRQALYFHRVGFNIHDTMIWVKDGGGSVGSNLCYRQNFEYMFVFSKGKPKAVNLIRDHINLTAGRTRVGKGRRRSDGTVNDENGHVRVTPETSRRNNWCWYPVTASIPAILPCSRSRWPETTYSVGAIRATPCSTRLWVRERRGWPAERPAGTSSALRSTLLILTSRRGG